MIKFRINDKEYIIKESVESICLFGSTARGDSDEFSDVDILVLMDDCGDEEFFIKKKNIEIELGLPAHWISLYRKSTLNDMRDYGSYFLWHVRNEGKILYSKTGIIEEILSGINEYTKVKTDLQDYLIICDDIKKSINEDTITINYELSVLASIVRNACIAFAYLNGLKVFGRLSSVRTCDDLLSTKLPFKVDEYCDLYKFRIAYTRKFDNLIPFIPTKCYVQGWVEKVEKLINIALNQQKGR